MEAFRYTAIKTQEVPKTEISEARPLAWLSYVSILFLVPLFARRGNRFALFHARQGMVLFAYEIGLIIASALLTLALVGLLLWVVGSVVLLVLCIMGVARSSMGDFWKCPLWVGKLADRLPVF